MVVGKLGIGGVGGGQPGKRKSCDFRKGRRRWRWFRYDEDDEDEDEDEGGWCWMEEVARLRGSHVLCPKLGRRAGGRRDPIPKPAIRFIHMYCRPVMTPTRFDSCIRDHHRPSPVSLVAKAESAGGGAMMMMGLPSHVLSFFFHILLLLLLLSFSPP